jgi:hypothetical protein
MGNSASKTPAPLKDRVKGSRTNKSGSAASKKSAQGIKLNASIIAGLTKKAKEYNEKHPKGKVSVTTLKAVMRRGMGAYSSSHRPTITGGAPNTRQAWAYARVNAFLRKKGGQGAKPTYVQDNDLLANGGQLGKEITCVNCGWHWNTKDSAESDKYVCHKCGYDNRTYYDKEPIGEYNKYLIYKSIGPLRQANETIEKIESMEGGGEIILTDEDYQFNGKDRKFKVNEPIFYEYSSSGDNTEAILLKKVDGNKVQIKISKKYTPYRSLKISGREKDSIETRIGYGLGKEDFIKSGLGKEIQEGTIKIVNKAKILPIKNYLPINYVPYSEEFKDYINNNYGQKNGYWVEKEYMAHGGLTKSLAVADVHKKYPELPKSFINAQLYLGMKAEMEHTKNPDVAKKIALDHLSESPFYYQYLTKMEKQLEGLDVKQQYNEQKNYAKGGEINPDNKGVKDYFAHGSGNVGGVLVGKRHSEGGIKAVNKSTNQPLEMEGGEVVITRNAVSDNEKREFEGEMLTNREILSRINESGGGVSFADGGDIPESIHTSGKEYAYGGKMVKDHDIVSSCGCKHTMAQGGKIYGQGGVVSMFDKEIPTYVAFQELFNGLKLPNLRKEYEGFLKENYKINFTQLPQKIRTGLLLGSQKLIDKYINK